jgi:hypothetical protein
MLTEAEMHVSYMVCSAWQHWQHAPISPASAAAIGGGPDPLEWMQEAGMKLGVEAPRAKPSSAVSPDREVGKSGRRIDFLGRYHNVSVP